MKCLKILMTIFVITSYMFVVTGCGSEDKEAGVYQIYYLDADGYGLKTEEYQLPQSKQDIVSIIKVLIAQLKSPVENDEKSAIDEGIDVVDFQIKETQLSVSFSAGYNNKSGVDEILSRAAIVKTLCQLKEIEFVEFYVEDQPLLVNGNAVGLMCSEDFVNELDPTDKEQNKSVSLFFANKKGTALREITTKITYNAAEPLAKLMVEALIAGPSGLPDVSSEEMSGTIPPETLLNNLTIRDNICYLDLSKEFMESDNPVKVSVRVYSVVNTLCELPNINSVQFTIDGDAINEFGDVKNFNLPLQRDLQLVEEAVQ